MEQSNIAWDNTSIYESLECEALKEQVDFIQKELSQIKALTNPLQALVDDLDSDDESDTQCMRIAATLLVKVHQLHLKIWDIEMYANSELWVDQTNPKARQIVDQMGYFLSELDVSKVPINQFINQSKDPLFEKFINIPEVAKFSHQFKYDRKMKDFVLDKQLESFLSRVKKSGSEMWLELYHKIQAKIASATMEIQGEDGQPQRVGVTSLLGSEDESLRKESFLRFNQSWSEYSEILADILHAIVGFELAKVKQKSSKRSFHFLESSLHDNRLSRDTLDALIYSIKAFRPQSQKIYKLMAEFLGGEKLDPWDFWLPCPKQEGETSSEYSFSQAMDLVRESYSNISQEMGDFVGHVQENNLVDARMGANRSFGYRTFKFHKDSSPRIFLGGFLNDFPSVMLLAHEMGHAFQVTQINDVSCFNKRLKVPASLAETTSLFSENLLFNSIRDKVDKKSLFSFLWGNMNKMAGNLLGIPMYFTFDCVYYQRALNKRMHAKDVTELLQNVWKDWMGDAFSGPDEMAWAKHIRMQGVPFHSYPYFLGNLLSQGIYENYRDKPEGFYQRFQSFLVDSCTMNVEEAIQTHLGWDATEPEFWEYCLNPIREQIDLFEKVLKDCK